MASLKDIAKKANVSISTVSKALSNKDEINIHTRKKIHEIADELNYVPNYRARALVNKVTKTIGIVVPYLNNFYYSELTQAIKERLKSGGYRVALYTKGRLGEDEEQHINAFRSGEVDGAIFVYGLPDNLKSFKELSKHIPLVFIQNNQQSFSEIGSVVRSNLKSAGYKLTNHLIDLGHRKIGYIGNKEQRYEGVREAMDEHGLILDEKFFYIGHYDHPEEGNKIGETLLKLSDLPTAIVCVNDEIAMGVAHSLLESGLRIPEDISIGGTDNIHFSKFYNPSLTTVKVSTEKVGERAAEIILEKLNNQIPENKTIVFPAELIIRKSTSVPNR